MVHDNDGEIRDVAIAFAANPDDPSLRRALCNAVYSSLQDFLLPCAKRLAPWYRKDELEDVLQNALYVVFQKAIRLSRENKLDTGRGPGKLGAYFRTIAANELIDQLTKASKSVHKWPLQLLVDPPADAQATVAELPEEVTIALGKLEPIDRMAVELRLLEGKSYAEIGAVIGTSAVAAKMRFHRALTRLRELIQTQPP